MARTVTWVGFWMAVLTITLLLIAAQVPVASFSPVQKHDYDTVFLSSLRIFFASLVAFITSQYTDIAVFKAIKTMTKNRMLWLRATGSTAVSQLIDTCVIQSIAWIGTPTQSKIPNIIITSYVVKLLAAFALTPLIYAGHSLVERRFGLGPVVLDDQGNVVTPLEKQL
jgi:queuosine precursor transporter